MGKTIAEQVKEEYEARKTNDFMVNYDLIYEIVCSRKLLDYLSDWDANSYVSEYYIDHGLPQDKWKPEYDYMYVEYEDGSELIYYYDNVCGVRDGDAFTIETYKW